MTFRVGQKVICISGPVRAFPDDVPQPSVGTVYTVREVFLSQKRGELALRLVEIKTRLNRIYGNEFGYVAVRFRPIVEKKTDIGFAHEILRKVSRKIRVRA